MGKNGKILNKISSKILNYNINQDDYQKINKLISSGKMDSESLVTYFEGRIGNIFNERLYLYSLLFHCTNDINFMRSIIDMCTKNNIDLVKQQFIFDQIRSLIFKKSNLFTTEDIVKYHKLYKVIFDRCKKELVSRNNMSSLIKLNKNNNRMVIFSTQFLGINHAPTRRVLDYTVTSIKDFGKEVLVINEAMLPRKVIAPFFQPFVANYREDLNNIQRIEHEGVSFDFYQFRSLMPDMDEIYNVLTKVADFNPGYILGVGGGNLVADLCQNIAPTGCIPCSSALPVTEGNFYMPLRKINKDDLSILKSLNKEEDLVIELMYTFKKPNVSPKKVFRGELNIPDNSFLIAVVGNRLDTEVDDVFLNFLDDVLEQNEKAFIVFAGKFDNYEKVIETSKNLKIKSVYAGYQKDILSFYEICDGYINPFRSGGGSSCAQALLKGVPVYTKKFGDAALAVGDYFSYESFNDMLAGISRSIKDAEFYHKLRKAAIERSENIFSSVGLLEKIFEETKVPESSQLLMAPPKLPTSTNHQLSKVLDILNKQIFFVVGCQKSGTTWVQRLLDSHPEISCHGEGYFGPILKPYLEQVAREYNQRHKAGLKGNYTNEDIQTLFQAAVGIHFSRWVGDKEVAAVGEKTPEHSLCLGLLGQTFPNSKIIHIIRDGRDVCVSGWFHNQRQGGTNFQQRFPDMNKYIHYTITQHWLPYIQKARDFGKKHPERYLELKYEDMHADIVGNIIKMLEFLGVDVLESSIEKCVRAGSFKTLSGGRDRGKEDDQSFFRKGIVGDWRNYFDDTNIATFNQLAETISKQLGYEI